VIIPPLDLKVYTVKAMVGEDSGIGEIFEGIVPFLLGCLFTISLFLLVPQVVLWLPKVQTGDGPIMQT
jgi:TRAP-type mannitol/chloroaromatic compound transport system permease large subunit